MENGLWDKAEKDFYWPNFKKELWLSVFIASFEGPSAVPAHLPSINPRQWKQSVSLTGFVWAIYHLNPASPFGSGIIGRKHFFNLFREIYADWEGPTILFMRCIDIQTTRILSFATSFNIWNKAPFPRELTPSTRSDHSTWSSDNQALPKKPSNFALYCPVRDKSELWWWDVITARDTLHTECSSYDIYLPFAECTKPPDHNRHSTCWLHIYHTSVSWKSHGYIRLAKSCFCTETGFPQQTKVSRDRWRADDKESGDKRVSDRPGLFFLARRSIQTKLAEC